MGARSETRERKCVERALSDPSSLRSDAEARGPRPPSGPGGPPPAPPPPPAARPGRPPPPPPRFSVPQRSPRSVRVCRPGSCGRSRASTRSAAARTSARGDQRRAWTTGPSSRPSGQTADRKSTPLNSSHRQ